MTPTAVPTVTPTFTPTASPCRAYSIICTTGYIMDEYGFWFGKYGYTLCNGIYVENDVLVSPGAFIQCSLTVPIAIGGTFTIVDAGPCDGTPTTLSPTTLSPTTILPTTTVLGTCTTYTFYTSDPTYSANCAYIDCTTGAYVMQWINSPDTLVVCAQTGTATIIDGDGYVTSGSICGSFHPTVLPTTLTPTTTYTPPPQYTVGISPFCPLGSIIHSVKINGTEVLSADISTHEGTISGNATPFLSNPLIEVVSTNISGTGMAVATDGGVSSAYVPFVDGFGKTHSGFNVTGFAHYLAISMVSA